jgi:hemerythrin-like domain-containing protein
MAADPGPGGTAEKPDTSDMYAVHNAFRRAFGEAPDQIESSLGGGSLDPRRVSDYVIDLLWFLETHHRGEDELVYPLLAERDAEHGDLFARMEAQHHDVESAIESTRTAAIAFGADGDEATAAALTAACGTLLTELDPHLSEEEKEILPIAADFLSVEEWGALPPHALQQYAGDRVWLPFGLVFEAMDADRQVLMLEHLPPPVQMMWTGGGSDAFAAEMGAIRGGSA